MGGGFLREVVPREVQLCYAISGQGIEQLGALFGSVFPLFLVKLAGGWGGGWEIPCLWP